MMRAGSTDSKRMGVAFGEDRDLMVHLVDQSPHVLGWEIVQLGLACGLEEVTGEVHAPVVVGLVGADHMPARAPNRLAQLGVQGLGAFRGGDAHDLAGLYALPPPRAKLTRTDA